MICVQVQKELNNAVQVQDFEQANQLRDRELELERELHTADTGTELTVGTKPQVGAEDIAHIVSAWTGVPVTQLTESESMMLLHLEDG